jgi:hypothetical protein
MRTDHAATPALVGERDMRVEPIVPADVNTVATTPLRHAQRTVRFEHAYPPISGVESVAARSWNALFGDLLTATLCVILGQSLAHLGAFQETHVGRLSAASVSQFLGAIGVVIFSWRFGRGMALRFRAQGDPLAVVCEVLTPLVTLLALAIAYLTLQRPIASLLDAKYTTAYNGSFLLATCAIAVWISMVVFSHAEGLRRLINAYRIHRNPVPPDS